MFSLTLIEVCFLSDFLYRHNVTFDNVTTEVEILDTSKCAVSRSYNHQLFDTSETTLEVAIALDFYNQSRCMCLFGSLNWENSQLNRQ